MTAIGKLSHASLLRPCLGETVSGDAVVVRALDDGLFVAIVDVLGHGPEAHELTHIIDAFLERHATLDVAALMPRLHKHLQGTRGAAVGLCAVNAEKGRIDYVGIGNTSIRCIGESETRLVSKDGIVGQNVTIRIETAQGSTRFINGMVRSFTGRRATGRLAAYQATVVPALWMLTRTSDCKIYQNVTVPDIITEVLNDHGITDFDNETVLYDQ